MIKRILTVGDSFTYGDELTDCTSAWPYILAQKLNATVNNKGQPGTGNKSMIRNVIHEIATGPVPDLVVIGWSSPGRMEFADDDGIFDLWPGYNDGDEFKNFHHWRKQLLNYIDRHHDTVYLFSQYLLDIILLQSFLKDKNIKYIMTKTTGQDYYQKVGLPQCQLVEPLIDRTYFLGWPNEGMRLWAKDTKVGPNDHFLEDGHIIVAEKIYEHIRHLGWLS